MKNETETNVGDLEINEQRSLRQEKGEGTRVTTLIVLASVSKLANLSTFGLCSLKFALKRGIIHFYVGSA